MSMPALNELIPPNAVAMLATLDSGRLVSRPVTTLAIEGADTLWFIVAADSSIASDIDANAELCLSYIERDASTYASLRGVGNILLDPERVRSLWSPYYKAWFEGPDDPNIALLRVTVHEFEHWTIPSSTAGRMYAIAKAVATGSGESLGNHGRGAPPPPDARSAGAWPVRSRPACAAALPPT